MAISMSRAEYDALVDAGLTANTAEIERLRDLIDVANGITRYRLFIRWQDVGGDPPTRIELGQGWPALETFLLEQELPIAREDVNKVTETQASNPVSIQVTLDRNGVVGWTEIDLFDFVAAAS